MDLKFVSQLHIFMKYVCRPYYHIMNLEKLTFLNLQICNILAQNQILENFSNKNVICLLLCPKTSKNSLT